jgi:hypothetical protein
MDLDTAASKIATSWFRYVESENNNYQYQRDAWEQERRHRAALVLQNELYWRPLERRERMLQREENMAARAIQKSVIEWYIRTRKLEEERKMMREARRQQIKAERADRKAEQARKVHDMYSYKTKSMKADTGAADVHGKIDLKPYTHAQADTKRYLGKTFMRRLGRKREIEAAQEMVRRQSEEHKKKLREQLADRARRRATGGAPRVRDVREGGIPLFLEPGQSSPLRKEGVDQGRPGWWIKNETVEEKEETELREAEEDEERSGYNSKYMMRNHYDIKDKVNTQLQLQQQQAEVEAEAKRRQQQEEEEQEEYLESIEEGDEGSNEGDDEILSLDRQISAALSSAELLLSQEVDSYEGYIAQEAVTGADSPPGAKSKQQQQRPSPASSKNTSPGAFTTTTNSINDTSTSKGSSGSGDVDLSSTRGISESGAQMRAMMELQQSLLEQQQQQHEERTKYATSALGGNVTSGGSSSSSNLLLGDGGGDDIITDDGAMSLSISSLSSVPTAPVVISAAGGAAAMPMSHDDSLSIDLQVETEMDSLLSDAIDRASEELFSQPRNKPPTSTATATATATATTVPGGTTAARGTTEAGTYLTAPYRSPLSDGYSSQEGGQAGERELESQRQQLRQQEEQQLQQRRMEGAFAEGRFPSTFEPEKEKKNDEEDDDSEDGDNEGKGEHHQRSDGEKEALRARVTDLEALVRKEREAAEMKLRIAELEKERDLLRVHALASSTLSSPQQLQQSQLQPEPSQQQQLPSSSSPVTVSVPHSQPVTATSIANGSAINNAPVGEAVVEVSPLPVPGPAEHQHQHAELSSRESASPSLSSADAEMEPALAPAPAPAMTAVSAVPVVGAETTSSSSNAVASLSERELLLLRELERMKQGQDSLLAQLGLEAAATGTNSNTKNNTYNMRNNNSKHGSNASGPDSMRDEELFPDLEESAGNYYSHSHSHSHSNSNSNRDSQSSGNSTPRYAQPLHRPPSDGGNSNSSSSRRSLNRFEQANREAVLRYMQQDGGYNDDGGDDNRHDNHKYSPRRQDRQGGGQSSAAELYHELASLPTGRGHGLDSKSLALALGHSGNSNSKGGGNNAGGRKKGRDSEGAREIRYPRGGGYGDHRMVPLTPENLQWASYSQHQYHQQQYQRHPDLSQQYSPDSHSVVSAFTAHSGETSQLSTSVGSHQSRRVTKELAHRIDKERALLARLTQEREQTERGMRLAKRAPQLRTDKRGHLISSDREVHDRALQKQRHLNTYDAKSGLFGTDVRYEREMRDEDLRLQREKREQRHCSAFAIPDSGTYMKLGNDNSRSSSNGSGAAAAPPVGARPSYSNAISPRTQAHTKATAGARVGGESVMHFTDSTFAHSAR